MKFKFVLSIIFLFFCSASYADARVEDSQQVCQKRIDGYKSGLEAMIKTKQNAEEARAELDKISKLPNTLPPCEKQKQIPALADKDEADRQASDVIKEKKTSD